MVKSSEGIIKYDVNKSLLKLVSRFTTYADYYASHPFERAKDAKIYDKNIKKYEDELNVLRKNLYKFEDRMTENIMDYDLTNQKTFYKWQWKAMQEEVKSYYH